MVMCGNCHQSHPTPADVKACYRGGSAAVATADKPMWSRYDDQWFVKVARGTANTGDKVTVHKKSGATEDVTLGVEYHANAAFSWFHAHKANATKFNNPGVGEGHYATASRTGNNDLDFWHVQCPTEGRWAGYTFVKRVIGGHDDTPVRGAEATAALEAIVATGVQEAMLAYGIAIGRCGHCNRHLTDEVSRAYGMGPVCRRKVGW